VTRSSVHYDHICFVISDDTQKKPLTLVSGSMGGAVIAPHHRLREEKPGGHRSAASEF
jgi:hypothetical protein